ncbi:hypothetical protein EOM60_00435 [Candidatus Saccharibacteria bacterium]|nr:hypothetical protein [Candidatus Saccharibacteria bacterium]
MSTTETYPRTTTIELESPPAVVELIAPYGLGFGEGKIGVRQRIEQGDLSAEVLSFVHELLTENPESFKSVNANGDGCGDGRWGTKLVRLLARAVGGYAPSSTDVPTLRAKVFGGGLAVASSMWRSITGSPTDSQTVGKDRKFMIGKLKKRGFSHGAHTDSHAEGGKCGCGAIDNYPLITSNVTNYRDKILETLGALYGDKFNDNQEAVAQALGVYGAIKDNKEYFADAGGKTFMEEILSTGAVVKQLEGDHAEVVIVLNDVPGTTLDQMFIANSVKERFGESQVAQAFSVDIWRGKEIADTAAKIALEEDANLDYETVHKLAFADFLIRTLAVSATLTAGDLPVYWRRMVGG